MKEQFLNFDLSSRLSNLGFDEDCFGWYTKDGCLYEGKMTIHQGLLLAPLYQKVTDWFREKYDLMIVQDLTSYGKYFFNIKNVKTFEELHYDSIECYDTFGQMIEKAVEKLIEILENEKTE